MPDKLTDNEIKKALECCKYDGIICRECPYKKVNGCMEKLSADALDLINRLQTQNGIYETCNARKDEAIKHLESEVKRLQAENERLKDYKQLYEDLKAEHLETIELINKGIKTAKAEAYKECIEKVKERLSNYVTDTQQMVFELRLDNLLKELVGDKNV